MRTTIDQMTRKFVSNEIPRAPGFESRKIGEEREELIKVLKIYGVNLFRGDKMPLDVLKNILCEVKNDPTLFTKF
jgi:hypothetical protein